MSQSLYLECTRSGSDMRLIGDVTRDAAREIAENTYRAGGSTRMTGRSGI